MLPEVSETATWTAPDEGERLWFLGTLATIKVPGEASHGRFALIEFLFPRYASPPLHTHPQDESYIVLEGNSDRKGRRAAVRADAWRSGPCADGSRAHVPRRYVSSGRRRSR
jgi:hypothetical protein